MTDATRSEKRPRERAALAIFLVLMLLGGVVLFGYFSTGRDWSVAATLLDDSVGSMGDYSVVVFAGTAAPEPQTSRDAVDARSTMEAPYVAAGQGAPSDSPSEGVSQFIKSVYQRFEKRKDAAGDEGVYVSDVRDLYELKGASVVTLKAGDADYYARPVVLRSKNRSFGVFSVGSYTSRVQMKAVVAGLKAAGADSIVCLAPRSAMVSTYDGVDVVVLTDESPQAFEELAANRAPDDPLFVASPQRGTTGVVIFSSNNVPAFKTIEEL